MNPAQIKRTKLNNSREGSRIVNYSPLQSEKAIQENCFKWFRYAHPKYSKLFFAIENGGSRNIIEAMNLKKRGVTPGIADSFLAIPKSDNKIHGCFIEFKRNDGKQSIHQKEFQNEISKYYHYEIIRSLDEFINFVTGYLM